jgi:hypothetical protein
MKVRTFLIMTGAALALSASVAQARMLPVKQTVIAHHKVTATKTSKRLTATQPLYIYVAGPAVQATNTTSGDDTTCDPGDGQQLT